MSKFQPDHLGRKTPDSNPAPALSSSHGFNADQPYRGSAPNIARDAGRGKDVHPIKVHGAMTDRQVAGAAMGGMGHPTAIVDGGQAVTANAAAAPLAHAYGSMLPKVRNAAPTAWNNKSRQGGLARSLDDPTLHELGRCIADEAARSK